MLLAVLSSGVSINITPLGAVGFVVGVMMMAAGLAIIINAVVYGD